MEIGKSDEDGIEFVGDIATHHSGLFDNYQSKNKIENGTENEE